jgi:hypothetical protein
MSISKAKIGGVTVLVLLLLFAALGPAKWQYRTGFGWQIDHVVGYFGFTLMFWLAWPRPFVVGGALVAAGILLEALQALTPDRHCDFQGALYSVAGALAAGLAASLFTRALRRVNERTRLIPRWLGALVPMGNEARTGLVTAPHRDRVFGTAS